MSSVEFLIIVGLWSIFKGQQRSNLTRKVLGVFGGWRLSFMALAVSEKMLGDLFCISLGLWVSHKLSGNQWEQNMHMENKKVKSLYNERWKLPSLIVIPNHYQLSFSIEICVRETLAHLGYKYILRNCKDHVYMFLVYLFYKLLVSVTDLFWRLFRIVTFRSTSLLFFFLNSIVSFCVVKLKFI